MADMIGVFGTLLITGLGFPALLCIVWLSFPATVDRARQRIAQTPLRCFWLGAVIALLLAVPILALLNIPGPGQFSGGVILLVALTISTIGAAGMAAQLGEQIKLRNQGTVSAHAAFLLGATILELAVIFPVIGWFIFLPIALLCGLGNSALALLRRRTNPVTHSSTHLSPTVVA